MNHEAVYRTAPVTPGLLIIRSPLVPWIQLFKYMVQQCSKEFITLNSKANVTSVAYDTTDSHKKNEYCDHWRDDTNLIFLFFYFFTFFPPQKRVKNMTILC